MTRELADRTEVLRGRCLSYGQGTAFWPIAEIIRSAAGISDDDALEVARAKVQTLAAGAEEGNAIFEPICSVVGLSSEIFTVQETFWATRKLLETIANKKPLIVVFEDVHWGEPTFLELIDHVVEFASDVPIVLVCTARRELLEARPDWMADGSTTSVALEPLSASDGAHLVEDLLGSIELGPDVASRVMDAAGGNPLFVEQMVSMWIEDGVLARANGKWVLSSTAKLTAPPTIAALLSSRLDRLGSDERSVIGAASVIGQEFQLGAVEELCSQVPAADMKGHLAVLVDKELVRPDGSTFVGQQSFWFRHALIRDAAYASLLKRVRAALHERFARWLQDAMEERFVEFEEILGYHLEQSYRLCAELGPVDEAGRAIAFDAAQHLGAAGRRAHARSDLPAAINLLTRASDLLPEHDEGRADLLGVLGEALAAAGQFERAEIVLAEALEHARDLDNRGLECRVLLARIKLQMWTNSLGSLEYATSELTRIVSVFEELNDSAGLARAWLLSCDLRYFFGSAIEAQRAAEHAIEHARRAGDANSEDWGLGWLAVSMSSGPVPAEQGLETCNEILAGAPSRIVAGGVYQSLARLSAFRGRFDEARAYGATTVRTFQDWGHRSLRLPARR